MSKGGRRKTSWSSGWNSGKTKLVRIPIALEFKVMEYAKSIDAPNDKLVDVPQRAGDASLILEVIEKYIEYKRTKHHPNQHSKELDINTRAWDELRKFRQLVKDKPDVLGLGKAGESPDNPAD
ncbi:hypothetical protein H6G33_17865 [Calothrix sp. FACHB-1219]|uniref:hypothetical protein n=1 Tax=unclassified Calothrix TaxID=2619626 RepID=UPI0016838313|nr:MULTISPECIES: hypothetical protein [unclassified Calothrix]MBD2202746.1 hypothetical protein [Calothrix sp. FACHB-168]MBD2218899.1 hypothetical protein [Calothrix sp. FACHB-1219]